MGYFRIIHSPNKIELSFYTTREVATGSKALAIKDKSESMNRWLSFSCMDSRFGTPIAPIYHGRSKGRSMGRD
jgi:hypothetical protein